jgi:hypothetical protein
MNDENGRLAPLEPQMIDRVRKRKTVGRLYAMALWSAYLLLFQSLILLWFQNDFSLKSNLLMQIAALTLLGLFSKTVSGTYLNAPLVFAGSIFIWHSTFLLGHYFQLAPIFVFEGGAFDIGFAYVYKATALVGLSLALAIVGMIWGYRRERIEAKINLSRSALTRAYYSSLGSASKRIAWYLFVGMVSILVLFVVREGPSVFGGKYIDFYAYAPTSLNAVLFFRSELFWVFVVILLIACYKDEVRVRNLVAVLIVAVCALLAMLGPRTGPFMCLTALLLSWDCFVRRVKLRWIAIFVLFLSAASFVIASGRGASLGIQIFNFAETGREKLDLLSLFHEQGRSIEVVLRTMEFSERSGLMYGRTFVDSIVSVVPLPILNLVGYRFAESPATWIVENSPDIGLNEGAGSSLIAELYYNFGMLGCLSFLIIGWFISRAYFKYAFSGNIFTGLNVMTVVALYTVMMRNDSGGCWRLLIYGFIVVAVLRRKREDSFVNCQKAKGSNLRGTPVIGVSPKLAAPAPLDNQA